AGTCTNFEHLVRGLEIECFDHQSDDIGLGYRLLFVNRQRCVLICEFRHGVRQKRFTPYTMHRLKDLGRSHAATSNLFSHHPISSESCVWITGYALVHRDLGPQFSTNGKTAKGSEPVARQAAIKAA